MVAVRLASMAIARNPWVSWCHCIIHMLVAIACDDKVPKGVLEKEKDNLQNAN